MQALSAKLTETLDQLNKEILELEITTMKPIEAEKDD